MDMSKFLCLLSKSQPSGYSELSANNKLEVLIAVILSAQCRDAQVNRVTPALFQKYKSIDDYISISQEELEDDISSITMYRRKARAIKEACVAIKERFNGDVPLNVEDLKTLSGVGSKTANVVASWFGAPSGFVVDTHVKRITKRLGLTDNEDPEKVRMDLENIFPSSLWSQVSGQLILHGRYICKAIRPRCGECHMRSICQMYLNKI